MVDRLRHHVRRQHRGHAAVQPRDVSADEAVPPPSWPDTLWQLAWLVPGTAITVKRFNDRDWPWWLGYAFGAVGVFCSMWRRTSGCRSIRMPAAPAPRLSGSWLAVLLLVIHRQRVHPRHARPQSLRSRSTGRSPARRHDDRLRSRRAGPGADPLRKRDARRRRRADAARGRARRRRLRVPPHDVLRAGLPGRREPLRAARQHRAQPLLCRPHRRRAAGRHRRLDRRRRSPRRSATASSTAAAPST